MRAAGRPPPAWQTSLNSSTQDWWVSSQTLRSRNGWSVSVWSFYNIDLSCRFFTCELQSQGIFILCMVQYIGVLSISTIHCSPPLSLVGSSYGSTRAFVPFEQQSGRAEIGFNLALSRSLAQDVPAMVGDPIVGQLVHHQVKRLVRRIRSQVPGWRRLWKLVTILVSQDTELFCKCPMLEGIVP